jgi:hypothetical protein
MKRVLSVGFIIIFFFSVTLAYAQTGTPRSIIQLNGETNSSFPDQSAGAITPYILRQQQLDVIATLFNPQGTVTIGPAPNSLAPALVTVQSLSGTTTNPGGLFQAAYANFFYISADNAKANVPNALDGWQFYHVITAGSQGARQTVDVVTIFDGASNIGSVNNNYVPLVSEMHVQTANGGTGTGAGTSRGAFFAGNDNISTALAATNLATVTGREIDVSNGGSAYIVNGLSIVNFGPNAGAGYDAAINIGAVAAGGHAWNFGLQFTAGVNGSGTFGGVATTGTMIGTDGLAMTVGNVLDVSTGVTISNFFLNSQNFQVAGSGLTIAKNFIESVTSSPGTAGFSFSDGTVISSFISSTSPAHSTLGTTSNHPLYLITNNSIQSILSTAGVWTWSAYGAGIIHSSSGGLLTSSAISLTADVSGVLPAVNGGTNCSVASIGCFNNITGFSAAGTTGTTSTNLVFSGSPTVTSLTNIGNITSTAPAATDQFSIYNTTSTGQNSGFALEIAGSTKWDVYDTATTNTFVIVDAVNSQIPVTITPGVAAAGFITFGYTTAATAANAASVVVSGGLGVGGGVFSNGVVRSTSGFNANGNAGLTQTCTVNQAKTLIFTLGILTGGTCNT